MSELVGVTETMQHGFNQVTVNVWATGDVTKILIDCNCFKEEVSFTGGATAYKDNVKMQEDMNMWQWDRIYRSFTVEFKHRINFLTRHLAATKEWHFFFIQNLNNNKLHISLLSESKVLFCCSLDSAAIMISSIAGERASPLIDLIWGDGPVCVCLCCSNCEIIMIHFPVGHPGPRCCILI